MGAVEFGDSDRPMLQDLDTVGSEFGFNTLAVKGCLGDFTGSTARGQKQEGKPQDYWELGQNRHIREKDSNGNLQRNSSGTWLHSVRLAIKTR